MSEEEKTEIKELMQIDVDEVRQSSKGLIRFVSARR
jgi:hypothetical protein